MSTDTEIPTGTAPAPARVELAVGGMTCASCAARIEKKLNRLDGVTATVNFATETATVAYDPATVSPDDLVATVEATGYTARRPEPPSGDDAGGRGRRNRPGPGRDRRAAPAAARLRRADAARRGCWRWSPALQFRFWQWASLTLAAPVVVWGAWPFHRAAALNARHRAATMDTLISRRRARRVRLVAVRAVLRRRRRTRDADAVPARPLPAAAAARDLPRGRRRRHHADPARPLLRGPRQAPLRRGAARPARARRQGRRRARATAPRSASRSSSSRSATGSSSAPGRRSPPTAVVEDGTSAVDARMLTGESVPVEVGPGDEVAGATVNAGGRLVVRATRVGADTALAQIARLVDRGADRQGAGAAPRRPGLRGLRAGRHRAVAGHPGVLAASTGADATDGVHRRGRRADHRLPVRARAGHADRAARRHRPRRPARHPDQGPARCWSRPAAVDTIVLDKTGTVTTGRMSLVDGRPRRRGGPATRCCASPAPLEDASEHPIAAAIAAAAAAEVGAAAGRAGVHRHRRARRRAASSTATACVAGRPRCWPRTALTVPAELDQAPARAPRPPDARRCSSAWDGRRPRGCSSSPTPVKPTSAEAIARAPRPRAAPRSCSPATTRATAARRRRRGRHRRPVIAEVLPADKVAVVQPAAGRGPRSSPWSATGSTTPPRWPQADLGIAMGTGTDVAIEASDLTLVRGDLRAAADAIRLSRAHPARRSRATCSGRSPTTSPRIPLAAAGLLNPMIAGAAMAFSRVFVVTNSLRLRRFAALHGS